MLFKKLASLLLSLVLFAAPALAQINYNSQLKNTPFFNVKDPRFAGGAKGDGSTDDTAAIQAAITAYCSAPTTGGGTIYFPPGNYFVNQPQTPSTSDIFTLCAGLTFEAGNSFAHPSGSVSPPQTPITASCGTSPNDKPVFDLNNSSANNVTFKNLVITGCNQAVRSNATVVHFENVELLNAVESSYPTTNAALYLYDSFWIWFDKGGIQTNKAVPTILMVGDNCGVSCTNIVGLFFMQDSLLIGGTIEYEQTANVNGGAAGTWVFRNVTRESANTAFLTISSGTGITADDIGPIVLDTVVDSDNIGTNEPLVSINMQQGGVSGLFISSSEGGNAASSPAIQVTAGTLDNYSVNGCTSDCSNLVTDGSGNHLGTELTLQPSTVAHDISSAACNSAQEGRVRAFTDATSATNGATITGGGTHHVIAYCNGQGNWIVVAGT